MGVAVHGDLFYCTCPRSRKGEIDLLKSKIERLEEEINQIKLKINERRN